jgi:hypothetical protein
MSNISKEDLARVLHESGREAVLAGNTVAAEKFGEKTTTFIEWDDCSEKVKEGRRIQAEYLLNKFNIQCKHQCSCDKKRPEDTAARDPVNIGKSVDNC